MLIDISIRVRVMKDPIEFVVGVSRVFGVEVASKDQRVVEIIGRCQVDILILLIRVNFGTESEVDLDLASEPDKLSPHVFILLPASLLRHLRLRSYLPKSLFLVSHFVLHLQHPRLGSGRLARFSH